jgi:hypothetical protein
VYLKVLVDAHGTTEQRQRRPGPRPRPVLERPGGRSLVSPGTPLPTHGHRALLAGWALGCAGLYSVVGLRARSPEALTALVPLTALVSLFVPIWLLSTAYVPAELLPGLAGRLHRD